MLIKDLEFDPKYTDEQYDRCIHFFNKEMHREIVDTCTKYIIVGESDPFVSVPAACHAGIGYHSVANPMLVATEIALNRKNLQECDGAWQYLRWMIDESFASRFIVNRPEHRGLEWIADNGIIVSTEVIQPLFQMIMILSRSHSERSVAQFTKWKEMVDEGFDPNFAYQVCMCVTGGSEQLLLADQIVSTRTSHTTTYLLNMECMKLFCEGDLGTANYEKRHYKNHRSVYGCHELFQVDKKVGYNQNFYKDLFANDTEFVTRMKVFRNQDTAVEGYRPPNPFTINSYVAAKKPDDVTYQEYFEVVIPYMKEKGMFYNAPDS